MKFFKFLLQILAMGFCFVAGMLYERNLLQKAASDNTEIGIINDQKDVNDDIIMEVPTDEKANVGGEVDLDANIDIDGDMLIDNNTVNIEGDAHIQEINNNQTNPNGQQLRQDNMNTTIQNVDTTIQEQQPINQEQPIIINDIEPLNNESENNVNTTQSLENGQISSDVVNMDNTIVNGGAVNNSDTTSAVVNTNNTSNSVSTK